MESSRQRLALHSSWKAACAMATAKETGICGILLAIVRAQELQHPSTGSPRLSIGGNDTTAISSSPASYRQTSTTLVLQQTGWRRAKHSPGSSANEGIRPPQHGPSCPWVYPGKLRRWALQWESSTEHFLEGDLDANDVWLRGGTDMVYPAWSADYGELKAIRRKKLEWHCPFHGSSTDISRRYSVHNVFLTLITHSRIYLTLYDYLTSEKA